MYQERVFSRPFAQCLVGSMVVTRRGREARSRSQRPTLPEALEWGPSMAVWCLRACLACRRLHALHGSTTARTGGAETHDATLRSARPPPTSTWPQCSRLRNFPTPTLSTSLPNFAETKTKSKDTHTHIQRQRQKQSGRRKLHPPGVQRSSHLEFPNAHYHVHCPQNGTRLNILKSKELK